MTKLKVALQRHGIEIEIATSIPVAVGNYVVVRAPAGYESYGVFVTGLVLEVSTDTTGIEEKFVQKIDTNYFDQMEAAKLQAAKMRETLDKIWMDKSDDEKLAILATTEPEIVQEPVVDPVLSEPIVENTVVTEEPVVDETITTDGGTV